MYDNTYLKFNSATGHTTRGLFQGAKLSCELFIIYLGQVLEALQHECERVNLSFGKVCYVDDIVMIVDHNRLAELKDITEKVFYQYGFTLNMKEDGSKSAVMPHVPQHLLDKKAEVETAVYTAAQNCKLPITDAYKYLGVTIDPPLSPKKAIDLVAEKIMAKYTMLRPAIGAADYRFKVNSFWTFIIPMMLNIPIFTLGEGGDDDFNDFAKLFYRSAKVWIGLPIDSEQELVEYVISTDPSRIREFIKSLSIRPMGAEDKKKLGFEQIFTQLYNDRGARFIGNRRVIA